MKVAVKKIGGGESGEREVKFPVITDQRGEQAVHDVVVAHMAAQRQGTACTKTMGEVAGTGKKPWRQKGTGRARAGSFASPLWRGGGVVFGPKPRDFRKKVTKSTRRLALQKAISERLNAGDVTVVDDFVVNAPKTKEFLGALQALEIGGTTLVVVSEVARDLTLASRNVPWVEVTTGRDVNTFQILRFDKIIFTQAGFDTLEERLSEQKDKKAPEAQ